MTRGLAKRLLHLALLIALVGSALLGAFDISAPFTQSAFADGYSWGGSYASCCSYSSQCSGTKVCCNPTPIETSCNPPTKPGYCKAICN